MNLRYLEHDELYREALLRSLEGASRSLWLATATLKQTLVEKITKRSARAGGFRPLAEALTELAASGVEVRLLHSGAPSRPFLDSLERTDASRNENFQMRRCARVHFKTIIVDGASAYVGSANLTGAGLGAKKPERRNFEVGFWLDDDGVVGRLRALFSAVWDGVFCAECGMAGKCPGIF